MGSLGVTRNSLASIGPRTGRIGRARGRARVLQCLWETLYSTPLSLSVYSPAPIGTLNISGQSVQYCVIFDTLYPYYRQTLCVRFDTLTSQLWLYHGVTPQNPFDYRQVAKVGQRTTCQVGTNLKPDKLSIPLFSRACRLARCVLSCAVARHAATTGGAPCRERSDWIGRWARTP
jgi:hypothetical protein